MNSFLSIIRTLASPATPDGALCAAVDKLNSLFNTSWRESGEEAVAPMRREILGLLPSFEARIAAKSDPQDASDVVFALQALIYGRSVVEAGMLPAEWRTLFRDTSAAIAASWRRNPRLAPGRFARHLVDSIADRHSARFAEATAEIHALVASARRRLASCNSVSELIELLQLRVSIVGLVPPPPGDRFSVWMALGRHLADTVDPSRLDTATAGLWNESIEAINRLEACY